MVIDRYVGWMNDRGNGYGDCAGFVCMANVNI